MIRIISWNVNGIRAIREKGFKRWLRKEDPDILCLQETKADKHQVPKDLRRIAGYRTYFSSPEDKKGYSGVALFTKKEPLSLGTGIGIGRVDNEGRIQIACYDDLVLINVYFPNGKSSKERLRYKLDFYDSFLEFVGRIRDRGERVVICGDVNTAHKEIDLARPRENQSISGFLPEERAWIDKLLARGFIDTFRVFDRSPGQYTWWDMKTKARERNVGWRIDYFFISENLLGRLEDAFILKEAQGSDHCPVGITLRQGV
ncbi:MAG: exodeoxyribonuclease III [Methanomassiliicoccales archaeon]